MAETPWARIANWIMPYRNEPRRCEFGNNGWSQIGGTEPCLEQFMRQAEAAGHPGFCSPEHAAADQEYAVLTDVPHAILLTKPPLGEDPTACALA